MRRREFIAGLGTVLISPLVGLRATSAQQPLLPVIGYLDLGTPEGREGSLAALSRGLADLGFFEGRNVRIRYRSAEQQPDRLPELAAEMVREPVTVIAATGGSVSALAAKAATKTIPIVFVNGGDPVANGLVSSLNRPGANVTGISFLTGELSGKRLDILRELVPGAATIAYFDAPGIGPGVSDTIAAAHTLGRQLIVLRVASAADIS